VRAAGSAQYLRPYEADPARSERLGDAHGGSRGDDGRGDDTMPMPTLGIWGDAPKG
jgi:hypothetical protein